MFNYDYSLEPGKKLEIRKYSDSKPVISVIIPFYNDLKYIEQSVKCILNQTYPYYEILIIDDGSTDKASLKKLDEVSKYDSRIKVFHKENEGLAATRDYGATKACKDSKYLFFLDSDDLVEKTFLECAYWTLETNKDAAWVYCDSCGFDGYNYMWNYWFDSDKLKKVNDLESANFIRRSCFEDVGGYGLKEKAVNEDWNFWLKQIAKGNYPVHMSFYGKWYRRKESGELVKANQNKARTMEIISETMKGIKGRVEAVQYPRFFNKNIFEINVALPKYKENKESLLLFISNMSDKYSYVLDFIKKIDKEKYNIIIISNEPHTNELRQQLEVYSCVYDLSSFIDNDYWESFVYYIIEKENISKIYIESLFGKTLVNLINAKYDVSYFNLDSDSKINKKDLLSIIKTEVNIDSGMDVSEYFDIFGEEYKELVFEYQRKVYGETLIDEDGNNTFNYKRQLLKEKLWDFSLWRKIVNCSLWKKMKKLKRR